MAKVGAGSGDTPARVRVDKWLWAARFFKTRTLAAQAVDAGQVRINGERVKPAHAVAAGATVEVTAVSERRGSATDAALLYRETAESAALRAKAIAERAAAAAVRGSGRPTKKDRRKLEDFLNEP